MSDSERDSTENHPSRDPGTGENAGENPGGGFQPAEAIAAWKDAFMAVAARFMRPPLVFAGRTPERPPRGEIGRRARGFPLVGLAVGLTAAIVFGLATWLGLPQVLAAVIAVAVMAFAGSAIFESGLARFADAWIAADNRADMLDALRDGRLGTYGILTLVIAFALRVGAIAWIASTGAAMAAIIAAATVSRAVVPLLLYRLPPARPTGLAADIGRPTFDETVIAVVFGVAVVFLFLGPGTGIVALAVGSAGAVKIWWLARRGLGGVTGSVLGAAQQAAEIGVLLAVVALH